MEMHEELPRNLLKETKTAHGGYPLYCHRKPGDRGFVAVATLHGEDVEIDNKWVVAHSPLLCKAFKVHINVEFCSSVQFIKYVCKYVHNGSDQAVFTVNEQGRRDEVTTFQLGRYMYANEAAWHI